MILIGKFKRLKIMEKYWHILYTKPSTERKVASALAKKKIEYFVPLCYKQKNLIFFNKLLKEPLFSGYVFVYVDSAKLTEIQNAVNALSILYWKGKPAIISGEDVRNIREFVDQHNYIEVLPIGVNSEVKSNINKSPLIVGQKPFSHFRNSLNVILPSLGYILSANDIKVVRTVTVLSGERRERVSQ